MAARARESSVETQEGTVAIDAPVEATASVDVAYASPLEERLAREAAAEREAQIFRGEDWSDLPNFYCPLCGYATLDGDGAVLAHGAARHPGIDLKEELRG